MFMVKKDLCKWARGKRKKAKGPCQRRVNIPKISVGSQDNPRQRQERGPEQEKAR